MFNGKVIIPTFHCILLKNEVKLAGVDKAKTPIWGKGVMG